MPLGGGDNIAYFLARQAGDCVQGGDFHPAHDPGRPGVEGAAEDEGKAQNVVNRLG